MSFSSAQWTIPELCVWIKTRSKEAVSSLSPNSRASLRLADAVYPGAYAARDEVLEKAQQGTLKIAFSQIGTALQSKRGELTLEFLSQAEISDSSSGWMADGFWCVARRIGSAGSSDHSGLLVESATAKRLWPSPEDAAAQNNGEQNNYARLVVELAKRMEVGKDRDRDTMRIWMKVELGLPREDADALYKSVPKVLRQAQMGRPRGSGKVGMSGQTSKKPAEE